MKIDNIFIVFSIILIFIIACSNIESVKTADSCILFEHKKHWYKATKKSYDKWNTPIAFQLAVVNQESSFRQFAKPKRKKLFGIIPTVRPTTAFGYAQVINPTWKWYKDETGNLNASRANFYDIADFIGWYSEKTNKILGISKFDFYNQYLAYHEGHGGWNKKSYNSKQWLIKAAKKVDSNANMYNNQLKLCENNLNKQGLFGIF